MLENQVTAAHERSAHGPSARVRLTSPRCRVARAQGLTHKAALAVLTSGSSKPHGYFHGPSGAAI